VRSVEPSPPASRKPAWDVEQSFVPKRVMGSSLDAHALNPLRIQGLSGKLQLSEVECAVLTCKQMAARVGTPPRTRIGTET